MENIKIWHTPDERPEKSENIIFYRNQCAVPGEYVPEDDAFCDLAGFINYPRHMIEKWAYLDDLIATSKALDVAIGAFNFIGRPKANGESAATARRTLKKISEIMKGDK